MAINPFDQIALEEALRYPGQGTENVVVSIGSPFRCCCPK